MGSSDNFAGGMGYTPACPECFPSGVWISHGDTASPTRPHARNRPGRSATLRRGPSAACDLPSAAACRATVFRILAFVVGRRLLRRSGR